MNIIYYLEILINQMKLTVNIGLQTSLNVFFIRHIGTTVNKVTVISGLEVLKLYKQII